MPARILLVEDDPGDAQMISRLLSQTVGAPVQCVARLDDALATVDPDPPSIILLDLGLPDAEGLEAVGRLRGAVAYAPIVVLTGDDDGALGLRCIDAGADDFLTKASLNPFDLQRTIEFALSRIQHHEERRLGRMLQQYRDLASEDTTSVARRMAGAGAFRDRMPEIFDELQHNYATCLTVYLEHLVKEKPKPRSAMEVLATVMGDHGAGPRDVMDVHVTTIQDVRATSERNATAKAVDGRLFALEMMGLLVDYYRLGTRRGTP